MSDTYKRIKRHEIKELIESEYWFKVINMHEGDKGILLYTGSGIKMLKKVKRDDAKVQFAASAYQYLKDNGFKNISIINKALSGSCSIQYNNSKYIVQDYVRGRVMEIKTSEAALFLPETVFLFPPLRRKST